MTAIFLWRKQTDAQIAVFTPDYLLYNAVGLFPVFGFLLEIVQDVDGFQGR